VVAQRGRTLASSRSGLTLRERAQRWLERRRAYRLASSLASKWWIRRPLRAGRYVVLGGVLFASGREIGSIEYANDPAAKERELLEAVIRSAGGVRASVDGLNAIAALPPTNRTKRVEARVRPVVARCVEGARELARRRLEKAKVSGVKRDIDEAQALVDKISRPWKAVVVGTPDGGRPFINAWVTALCPRTVFVTEALVEELDPTPDELALCIGHELGHLICGHTEDRIYLKAMLAYAELILLAFLDPTGLLTLLGAMGFQNTAELFLAKNSRENETEADATGLTIAALACYDVRRGTHFMRKLSEATGSRPTSWWATHPATEDRYADLRSSSLGVHENVYGSHCTAVGKALQRLVTR
jgi:Zn-dependent protease with chaperone function